jgi:phage N-6-adenine-methyltransferase
MSHKIKPCPFCGGAIDYVNVDQEWREQNPRGVCTNGPDHYAFRCPNCEYELKFSHSNSQLRQIESFNKRPKKLKSLMTNDSDEWSTPQDFFDFVNSEFNFTMDGAATAENTKCSDFSIDFLNFKSDIRQRIWLNPPYSRNAEFLKKASDLANNPPYHLVVCLIPARTDTKYWQEWVATAREVRLLKGRLKFGNAKASAPFPSALVIFDIMPKYVPGDSIICWDWKEFRDATYINKQAMTNIDIKKEK